MNIRFLIPFILIFILLSFSAFSQPGNPDDSFGQGGKIITQLFPGSTESGQDIGLQPDGKIIALAFFGNEHERILLRYTTSGSIDSTFGTNGMVVADNNLLNPTNHSMVIDDSGRIILLGYLYDQATGKDKSKVMRFLPDGSIDPTFGSNGTFSGFFVRGNNVVNVITRQPDGKLVFAGSRDYYDTLFIVRILPEGAMDVDFGINGLVTIPVEPDDNYYIHSIAVDQDNNVILAGKFSNLYQDDIFCYRFDEYGMPDFDFGNSGRIDLDFLQNDETSVDIVPYSDHTILVSCTEKSGIGDFAVACLNNDGSFNTSFGEQGKVIIDLNNNEEVDYCYSICIQNDQKILLTGYSYYTYYQKDDFALVSLNPDGSRDADFGINGISQIDFDFWSDLGKKSLIQPDHRILTIGSAQKNNSYHIGICRILTELYLGKDDFSPDPASLLIYPNPVDGLCTVRIEKSMIEDPELKLYSMYGKVSIPIPAIYTNGALGKEIHIDLSYFIPGRYILELAYGQKAARVGIIIK
jgi:uncharacterized delta-60 repeat protein